MRGNLKDSFNWLRKLPHPSEADLMAFADGELERSHKAVVEAHLGKCVSCHSRLEQLQDGLRFFNHSSESSRMEFSVEAGFKSLRAAIEQREPLVPEVEPAVVEGTLLHDRLLSELSIYLGQRAAEQLLDRCNHSLSERGRLNDTVAPVVIGFLGQHTGSAVLTNVLRIWDQSQQLAS